MKQLGRVIMRRYAFKSSSDYPRSENPVAFVVEADTERASIADEVNSGVTAVFMGNPNDDELQEIPPERLRISSEYGWHFIDIFASKAQQKRLFRLWFMRWVVQSPNIGMNVTDSHDQVLTFERDNTLLLKPTCNAAELDEVGAEAPSEPPDNDPFDVARGGWGHIQMEMFLRFPPRQAPADPQLAALAIALGNYLEQIQRRFNRGKKYLMTRLSPSPQRLSQQPPSLATLTSLTDLRKIDTRGYIVNERASFLQACAYHRHYFFSRRHILPSGFGKIVHEHAEIQNLQVLESWLSNLSTWLGRRIGRSGKAKATAINVAVRRAKQEIPDLSAHETNPERLLEFLLHINDSQETSLIEAIARPRSRIWKKYHVAKSVSKLLEDFPSLQPYREHLLMRLSLLNYCRRLQRRYIHGGEQKAEAILAAIKRADVEGTTLQGVEYLLHQNSGHQSIAAAMGIHRREPSEKHRTQKQEYPKGLQKFMHDYEDLIGARGDEVLRAARGEQVLRL